MNIALIKRMMDACYQAKRVRDLLPALPDGVLPSFIQYLERCAQPAPPRRDPDRKGHGSSWSFDQAYLP